MALAEETSKRRATSGASPRRARTLPELRNADFYGPDGKFNTEAAKKAYFDFLRFHNYPINDTVRQNLIVSDMNLGKFTEVGLACVVFVNEKAGNYACLEVFLLPNQMIPEHWHVPLENEGVTPKMESWIVRYGSTFTYGEGAPTKPLSVKIPECQVKYVSVMHEKPLKPGESIGVGKPLEKHWQLAGPEGCIFTEVATYHAGAAVKFSDPRIKF